jgi:hypothetical protein
MPKTNPQAGLFLLTRTPKIPLVGQKDRKISHKNKKELARMMVPLRLELRTFTLTETSEATY